MKRLKNIALFASLLLFITSCGKSSKEKEPSTLSKIVNASKAVKNQSKNLKKLKGTMEDAQKLGEIEPMDQKDLKEWLPESIRQYKRTLYKTDEFSAMGTTAFKSAFTDQNDDQKKIDFDLIDGAGSFAATLIAGFNQKIRAGEEETEYGYKRSVEKNGYAAWEEQDEKNHTAVLTFVHNGRFLVQLKGKNRTAEELWIFAKELPLKKLP